MWDEPICDVPSERGLAKPRTPFRWRNTREPRHGGHSSRVHNRMGAPRPTDLTSTGQSETRTLVHASWEIFRREITRQDVLKTTPSSAPVLPLFRSGTGADAVSHYQDTQWGGDAGAEDDLLLGHRCGKSATRLLNAYSTPVLDKVTSRKSGPTTGKK